MPRKSMRGAVYDYLKDRVFKTGHMPYIDDIQKKFALPSRVAVGAQLHALEEEGKIFKDGRYWSEMRFTEDPFSKEELEDMARRYMSSRRDEDGDHMEYPYCLRTEAKRIFVRYCPKYDRGEYSRDYRYIESPAYESTNKKMWYDYDPYINRPSQDWPYNFLDEFWEHYRHRDSFPIMVGERELIGSIDYVLATSDISDREREAVRLRYQQKLTLDKLAKHYSLSSERCRQIVVKAMNKIRKDTKNKMILSVGVAGYVSHTQVIATNEKINELVEARVKEERMKEKRMREKIALRNKMLNLPNSQDSQYSQDSQDSTQPSTSALSSETNLKDLPLSVRTLNALQRAGINTLGDVLTWEKKRGIMNVPNFGKKCYAEIMEYVERVNPGVVCDPMNRTA